ncbi:MAG: hypothetical protein ACLR4Z_12055 [Butyricicoccaceae bacterium]
MSSVEDGPADETVALPRAGQDHAADGAREHRATRMMTIGRSELLRGEVSKIEDVLDPATTA